MEGKVDGFKDEMKSNMDDKEIEYHIDHQKKVLQLLKDNLNLTQNRMKQHANHNKRSFDVGD